ncbi:MAG TPA: lysoplasmalogenase [Parvularculaceae bacterium]|nr:lysoplasmalogenase [Parvularculaceae bacterium]
MSGDIPISGGPSPSLEKGGNALLGIGIIVGFSYLAANFVETPTAVDATWKAAGIVLFAAYAFSRGAAIAGVALLFGAGGDIALALRPPVFVAGMALFGVGHALYIVTFINRMRKNDIDRRFAAGAALIVLGSIALGAWYAPDMGALLIPGLFYQGLITAMAACAFIAPVPMLGRIGALSFMISDSMIGLGLYKHIAAPPGAIWIAYVAGQAMLAAALARKAAISPAS